MHQKYAESKKARRIAAIVYLLFMGFIFTGTYLSQQQKKRRPPKRKMHPDIKRVTGIGKQ